MSVQRQRDTDKTTTQDEKTKPLARDEQLSKTELDGETKSVSLDEQLLELEAVGELKFPNPPGDVFCICPINNDTLWVNLGSRLTQLDKKGKVMQMITHDCLITNISISPETQALWACDSNIVMELVSGVLQYRFPAGNQQPYCMCVNSSNHIVLGYHRYFRKFTSQGKLVHTGTNKIDTPFVCSPFSISECPVSYNIAVVDSGLNFNGEHENERVVVMDSDFQEQFTICRDDIPNEHLATSLEGIRSWDFSELVYDSDGNLVLGVNNLIVLISGSGKFLRVLHTGRRDITRLGVARQGDILWKVHTVICDNLDKTSKTPISEISVVNLLKYQKMG